MGEYRVHRVRFLNFVPKPVQCMAYDETTRKLAVARLDAHSGHIEIWDINDGWNHEQTLLSTKSVESVLWTNGRLFSAGLHGEIHEHDLVTGGIKRANRGAVLALTQELYPCVAPTQLLAPVPGISLKSLHTVTESSTPTYNGAVWCLARNKVGTVLAAGTEDGCVALFDILSEGIQYDRALNKQEGRILSLAWYDPENLIVTGGIDNIRVWSVASGRAIQRMNIGRGQEKNKETIVWDVAVTPDFTIISGDSRGKTSFWNGRMGTLIKCFKGHDADVYTLCVSPDGRTVYSSGIDTKVVRFQLMSCLGPNSDWPVWVSASVKSNHTNDVRSLIHAGDCIVSAGLDCQLIVCSIGDKKSARRTQRISAIPKRPLIQTLINFNSVLLRYPDKLELWRLGSTDRNSDFDGVVLQLKSVPVKLLELKIKEDGSEIVCSAASHCGAWVAYSDSESVKLYNLTSDDSDSLLLPRLSITRIRSLAGVKKMGAHSLTFTPDSKTLILACRDNSIQIIKIDVIQPVLAKTFTLPDGGSSAVHLLSVSPCGRYFAVAQLNKTINIYSLKKLKHVWSLPTWTYQPTAMAFNPSCPEIVVAYSDRKIIEYSIKDKEYTSWGRKVSDFRHPQWSDRLNKITQISYHPQRPHELLLHDDELLYIINKTQSMPDKKVKILPQHGGSRKRDSAGMAPHALHICDQFMYLMHTDILPDGFMVIVERPQLSLLEALPPPFKQRKFGI